jgi:hypothetical protein
MFPGGLAALMKARPYAPELHSAAHGGLDELGKGLVHLQHGFELGAQRRLDTDLGNDGGLHASSVLHLRYACRF